MHDDAKLGAIYLGDGSTRFVVWAPHSTQVDLVLSAPLARVISMEKLPRGYFRAHVAGAGPGARYIFRLDGGSPRPDPASRSQPDGVHGASQVIDRFFDWHDANWFGIDLQQHLIYEVHVGAFTADGTFDRMIPYLDDLVELGVTAIELLPVAQFPGERNWGYDAVFPFAVQNSYGGPDGLKRLVDACHRRGLAVLLDVVYNHFGPEGSYFTEFGPYFTDRYKTPWGVAMNFDGPDSDEVRRFFLENAEMWAREFHVDGLRLDAVDNIFDFAAGSFLEELARKYDQLEQHLPRKLYLMVESDLNSPRVVQPPAIGGYGLDAQWTDDFHHALYTLLTGHDHSYYIDFKPDPGNPLDLLARALRDGYVYSGQYSVFRRRNRGVSSRSVPGFRHVVFAQNHDQVGNRMNGERLGDLISFDALKVAAGMVLLSPYIPLLFMGEEYGETAPFQFFADYSDPELVAAVQSGRRDYFSGGSWEGEAPDPISAETFRRSKLNHDLARVGKHRRLREFYRELIGLRKTEPAFAELSKDLQEVTVPSPSLLLLRRGRGADQAAALFNLGDAVESICLSLPAGRWQALLDSSDPRWAETEDSPARERPPARLDPPDKATVTLGPMSFVVYAWREPDV